MLLHLANFSLGVVENLIQKSNIMLTRPYVLDPFQSYFYTVKLGFTFLYLYSLFFIHVFLPKTWIVDTDRSWQIHAVLVYTIYV